MFSITNKCKCISCSSSCAGLWDSWPSGWCSCCGTWQGAPAKKYGHLIKSLHSEHAGRFGWFWSGLATFRLQRFEHSSLHQAQPHLQSWAVCDPKISISPKQNAQKIKLPLDKIELVTSQSFRVYKLDQYLLMIPLAACCFHIHFTVFIPCVTSLQPSGQTAHCTPLQVLPASQATPSSPSLRREHWDPLPVMTDKLSEHVVVHSAYGSVITATSDLVTFIV